MSGEDNSSGDKVVFQSVPGSYRPGENISVVYSVEAALSTHQRDWIGLFRVGWTSNRDYYTFEWAPKKGDEEGRREISVKFSGTRLPPDDGHFYQFCYVSRNGMVRGASRPFQFTKESTSKDDLELVEVEDEDSLLLLQRHESEKAELTKTVRDLTLKTEAAEASILKAKSDCDEIQVKFGKCSRELEDAYHTITQNDNTIVTLKETIVQLQEESASLKKEIDLLQVAIAKKEAESSITIKARDTAIKQLNITLEDLQKEVVDKDSKIAELYDKIGRIEIEKSIVIKEKEESETQLRIQCSQLEERLRKAEEDRESAEGSSEYYQAQYNIMERKNEDGMSQLSFLREEKEKLLQELENLSSEKEELLAATQLKDQEVNVMRQNLCEVMGTINEPRDELPLPSNNIVSKSAIEALQIAYDDLENRYNTERKNCMKLKASCTEAQERVRRCGMEYQKLLKQTRKTNCDDIEEVQKELEQFQLKHDERMAEKNLIIEQQAAAIEKREEEVKQLRHREQDMKSSIEALSAENVQLRAQLQHHVFRPIVVPTILPPTQQRPPANNERVCPVCNARFPLRMRQEDFEVHVNTHFQ